MFTQIHSMSAELGEHLNTVKTNIIKNEIQDFNFFFILEDYP